MYCRTGLPRTSIIGLGRSAVSSRMRVPRPAASRTALSIFAMKNYGLKFTLSSITVRADGCSAIPQQISRDRVAANSREFGFDFHHSDRAGVMEWLRKLG